MSVRSTVFVTQFEGESHGDELGDLQFDVRGVRALFDEQVKESRSVHTTRVRAELGRRAAPDPANDFFSSRALGACGTGSGGGGASNPARSTPNPVGIDKACAGAGRGPAKPITPSPWVSG